jgi:hypothetical protein
MDLLITIIMGGNNVNSKLYQVINHELNMDVPKFYYKFTSE